MARAVPDRAIVRLAGTGMSPPSRVTDYEVGARPVRLAEECLPLVGQEVGFAVDLAEGERPKSPSERGEGGPAPDARGQRDFEYAARCRRGRPARAPWGIAGAAAVARGERIHAFS